MGDQQNGQADETSFEGLLKEARSGDADAIGRLLQEHRQYLLLVANQELDPQVQGKVGSSDVVQESLMTAHQEFGQFRGETRQQLLAWLRQIVKNDLLHARRTFKGTRKRQIDREQPLQFNSSLDNPIVDPEMTPATNALAEEESLQLKLAMAELPEAYQEVLRLHNWRQQSFVQIGEQMSKSPDSVRKLWTRAIIKLQEVMKKRQHIE